MAIQKGDHIQNFTLQNTRGEEVSLQSLLDETGRVLVLFIPLAFSKVCTDELCLVRNNMKLYKALKAPVIAISVDSFFVLREFKKANNLNFTLLSDFNKEVSDQFGVLDQNFFGMKGVSKRSAFVINSEMEIEYSEVLDDSDKLPDFKAITQALQNS